MKIRFLISTMVCTLVCTTDAALAQVQVNNLPEPSPCEKSCIEKLHSDSTVSVFVAWVEKEIPLHYHASHTETVYVLEGEGTMELGDSTFAIHPGQVLVMIPGTHHAVKKTGDTPLKAISVFSPGLITPDRILVEPKK
ncbi:MAG: cupin domain-containing protein [Flavobacteriales bacterium]|nr:cupin domain-containing protein [Flavobacteriales bacterium]MCB9448145.1 cupin domain-containing protein [Flavobacteriales bacterium]